MRIKLILFFMCVGWVGAQAQSTLPECVRIALANNPGLMAAESEAGIANEDVVQARAARWPSLDFSGSYRHQSSLPSLNIPPITVPFLPDPISPLPEGGITLGSKDTYDFKLMVSQPLFTGMRLKNRQAATRATAAGKQSDLQRQRAELIYKVETAYASVLKAQKYIQIASNAREQVAVHLKDVENLVTQGLARRDERLRVDVKLSEAELALVRAENGYAMALAALENLLGKPLTENLTLAEMATDSSMPTDKAASLAIAWQKRPELAGMAQAKLAGQAVKKVAQGGRWPSVAAFGAFAYGKPGLDFTKAEGMDYWLVGLGAEWNLWNRGKTSSQIQQAELKIRGLAESDRQVREAIQLDVTQAHLRLIETSKSLAVATQMVQQAIASFEVSERQYKQGVASHSDYFDAQSELTRARLLLAEAQIEEGLAKANWRRAVGVGEQEYSH